MTAVYNIRGGIRYWMGTARSFTKRSCALHIRSPIIESTIQTGLAIVCTNNLALSTNQHVVNNVRESGRREAQGREVRAR